MALILNWKGRWQPPADVRRPATQPRLLEQVRDVIRRKHYNIRTERAYIQWARRFILFHGKRHPREMGARKVGAIHLAGTTS